MTDKRDVHYFPVCSFCRFPHDRLEPCPVMDKKIEEFVANLCPSCSSLRARDEVWREKKRVLESDLGKAWEDNKRLREAVTYADKFIEDQAAFYKRGNTWDRGNDPMYDISVAALAELRRRAKEG